MGTFESIKQKLGALLEEKFRFVMLTGAAIC